MAMVMRVVTIEYSDAGDVCFGGDSPYSDNGDWE